VNLTPITGGFFVAIFDAKKKNEANKTIRHKKKASSQASETKPFAPNTRDILVGGTRSAWLRMTHFEGLVKATFTGLTRGVVDALEIRQARALRVHSGGGVVSASGAALASALTRL
jgi:hypothetical protein